MMNPDYHFARMRELLEEHEPSRERSLAATKLDECEMWLGRCVTTVEAFTRDQAAVTGDADDAKSDLIDALCGLVRNMLQSLPDTADEQEWRDLAGQLGVTDPDGEPYRAYTGDDL